MTTENKRKKRQALSHRKTKAHKTALDLVKRFPVDGDPSILPRSNSQSWNAEDAQSRHTTQAPR